MMKEPYASLYKSMLEELANQQATAIAETEKVTACFWIAQGYIEQVKLICNAGFENEMEEINFYKVSKPAFAAYSEFYTILSEALVCVPALAEAAMIYWEEEMQRVQRFKSKHQDLIHYYESGSTEQDERCFLQAERSAVAATQVLGSYLARKMYADYCSKKMEQLMSRENKKH